MEILTKQDIDCLRGHGTVLLYHPGASLYFAGDPADRLYYILKGRVRVYNVDEAGREVTLDVVGEGCLIGESAFAGTPRPDNVQAVTEVQGISCSLAELERAVAEKPGLAMRLLHLCSGTMDRLSARLQDQCTLNRFGKVAAFILDITETESAAVNMPDGRIPYTHEELAAALGLNRTTITSVLRMFETSGWIKQKYRCFVLKDRAALADFVESQRMHIRAAEKKASGVAP